MSGGDNKDVNVWMVEDTRLQTKTFNGKPIVNINSEDLTDASAVAVLVSEPAERIGWTGYTYGPPFTPQPEERSSQYVRLDDPDPVVFGDEDDAIRYQYDSSIAPAVVKAFDGLLHHKDQEAIDTLVLAQWGGRYADSTDLESFLDLLLEYEASFPNLKALFVGGVSMLDLDIHDIPLAKMGVLLNYFSQLESFKARGAPDNQSFFEIPIQHEKLKKLVLETADMDGHTIENLSKSYLPKLEHLELWFGDISYCLDTPEEVMLRCIEALLNNSFPSLRYLGLRNASSADEIAIMLANLPILEQLDELDLSLGSFSDIGAKALLKSPYIGNLKKLSFHHHSVKNNGLIRQLEAKLPEVDSSNGDARNTIFIYE